MSVSSITQPQMMRLLYACTKPFLYYHEMIQITINSFVCIRLLFCFIFGIFGFFTDVFYTSRFIELVNHKCNSNLFSIL